MKIYVASSWRNTIQPAVVQRLREAGHEVYDFREPEPGITGFAWSEIDPDWLQWTTEQFERGLKHPIARIYFRRDQQALEAAEACILVLPCGRSAHLEAGFAVGRYIPLLILIPADSLLEPELMYSWARWIGSDIGALIDTAEEVERDIAEPTAAPGDEMEGK